MKDRMDRLVSFIVPPEEPKETGSPKAWEKTEARLGLKLPSDYKTFIDRYGTGSFDDFLMVYNPFAADEYRNLFYALDTLHQADRRTKKVQNVAWRVVDPFDIYPAPEGLLPWGCAGSVDETFFWRIKGDPDSWETIFYNLRSGEYEVWKYPLAGFLLRLLARQIESVLLPGGYPPPERPVRFIPV